MEKKNKYHNFYCLLLIFYFFLLNSKTLLIHCHITDGLTSFEAQGCWIYCSCVGFFSSFYGGGPCDLYRKSWIHSVVLFFSVGKWKVISWRLARKQICMWSSSVQMCLLSCAVLVCQILRHVCCGCWGPQSRLLKSHVGWATNEAPVTCNHFCTFSYLALQDDTS